MAALARLKRSWTAPVSVHPAPCNTEPPAEPPPDPPPKPPTGPPPEPPTEPPPEALTEPAREAPLLVQKVESTASSCLGSKRVLSPGSMASLTTRVRTTCWAKYAAKVQALVDNFLEGHPQYSAAYLDYLTAPSSRREAAQVAFMIVVVPATQAWICWVPTEDVGVVIMLQGLGSVSVMYGAPVMLRACCLPYTFNRFFAVCTGLIGALGYLSLSMISYYVFNVFPVPLGVISYSILFSAFIFPPLVMGFMELEARQDPKRREATLNAYMLYWGLILLLCNGAPLSLAALALLWEMELAQVLALLSPWFLRKAFEALGRWLFRESHPEIIPTTRLIAISFYEGFLSIVMMSTANFKWYVIPMAIACDLGENLLYLVMIRHTAALAQRKRAFSTTELTAAEAVGCHRKQEMLEQGLIGLVSSVLVKEVMEVVMPMQTLVAMSAMYLLNPKWNVLCAGVSPGDFWQGISVLLTDVLLETIMLAMVMETVRRTCKLDPWSLLIRVMHHDLQAMSSMVIVGFIINIAFQHTGNGSDLSMQFRWLRDGAVWHGGMCWTFGEETPQEACRESWYRG